jgi:hypothetical protein
MSHEINMDSLVTEIGTPGPASDSSSSSTPSPPSSPSLTSRSLPTMIPNQTKVELLKEKEKEKEKGLEKNAFGFEKLPVNYFY